jgi:nucleoside 2-deoxyribosyltransferase
MAWRAVLQEALGRMGIICLSPTDDVFIGHVREDKAMNNNLKKWRQAGEFDKVQAAMKQIVQKDLRMVDISDFIIFNVDVDRPTWGTTHELVQAAFERKPVLLIVKDRARTPLWFMRYVGKESIFETLESVIQHLEGIHRGTIPFDVRYWKVLLEQYRIHD